MAKKDARQAVGMECTVCKNRNYITQKNTNTTKDKLSLNKYCKHCQKSTVHAEHKLK